jgi:hypothetical protein
MLVEQVVVLQVTHTPLTPVVVLLEMVLLVVLVG